MLEPRLIRCVDDLAAMLDPGAPIVTLFSGGLDGAYLLQLLAERGFDNVVAMVVDLGDDLDRERITRLGERFGTRVELLDRQADFVEGYVLPAIRAHAVYLGLHPVSASLSRPLIAKEGIALARKIGAQAILHTANQSQNTLRRLNGALRLLQFDGAYGSPYEFSAVSRHDKQRALTAAGIAELSGRVFSSDSNLWCREFESGSLDDPERFDVPAQIYKWSTVEPGAPATEVALTFVEGRPVELDGQPVEARELIATLNLRAGRYGIGRYVGLEHLASGEKVLEIREMPAAALLLAAYRQLESSTVEAETIREKLHVEQVWVREAVEGRWFGALRTAADAFIASVAQAVTGTVRMRLSLAGAEVTAIQAERPLYVRNREEWEARRVRRR